LGRIIDSDESKNAHAVCVEGGLDVLALKVILAATSLLFFFVGVILDVKDRYRRT
jgi:hypothetical protein